MAMDTDRIKKFIPRILGLLLSLSFCGLAWSAPPHAQKHAQAQIQGHKAPQIEASKTPHKAKQDKQPKHLGKMTVHGKRWKPICVLEWLKVALYRPYTTDPAKSALYICNPESMGGSRIRDYIRCETSDRIFDRQQRSGAIVGDLPPIVFKVTDRRKLEVLLNATPRHFTSACQEPATRVDGRSMIHAAHTMD
jgi:hypothetical protein